MSGLEKLTKLNVLSLGNNKIKNFSGEDGFVPYLKSLNNNLEVLTLMGNECAKTNTVDYKSFTVAFLSKLKYLDYELIDKSLRITA
jgi:Leucine-rich repeat (LRR) protein